MACSAYSLSANDEFLAVLNERVCGSRIPLCGGIDLTQKCNLDCAHCYICSKDGVDELTAEQIMHFIDQLAAEGCLFLLLTGGEPFLRNDFREIYEHAKQAGLLVSIFTNGTLIDAKMADFLAELPPHVVEISIYGAESGVHDMITGVVGSFERTMQGVSLLLERGIDVSLKTILMTLNRDEMIGMLDIAEAHGVRFRADGAIFPRLDGDKSPLDLRLSPKEVVEREFMIHNRSEHWKSFIQKVGEIHPAESLYDCGAGVSCFHITARGRLQPCIMASEPSYDICNIPFAQAWKKMAAISDKKADSDYPCSGCERRLMCDCCPGFFGLEMGDENLYSEYVCGIATERCKALSL